MQIERAKKSLSPLVLFATIAFKTYAGPANSPVDLDLMEPSAEDDVTQPIQGYLDCLANIDLCEANLSQIIIEPSSDPNRQTLMDPQDDPALPITNDLEEISEQLAASPTPTDPNKLPGPGANSKYVKSVVSVKAFAVSTVRPKDERTVNLTTSVKHQQQRGVCWAFAATGILESLELRQRILTCGDNKPKDFSEENVIYYKWHKQRAIPLQPEEGASAGTAADGIANYVVREEDWPYEGSSGPNNPPKNLLKIQKGKTFRVAKASGGLTYLQKLSLIEQRLKLGIPLFFWFNVFEEFMQASNNATKFHLIDNSHKGLVFVPRNGTLTDLKSPQGGIVHKSHAVYLAGLVRINAKAHRDLYDFLGGGYYIIKNSWGRGSGREGYLYIPFKYCPSDKGDCSAAELGTSALEENRRMNFSPLNFAKPK